MLNILGQDGKQVVSRVTKPKTPRAALISCEIPRNAPLVKESDGTIVLYIGAKNWPTPIPLVNKGSSWYFDTDAGKKEILFRRIGRNEISTIRVCQELGAAEKEYHSTEHGEYAQKIFSDEGRHNGLYWRVC